MLVLCLCVCMFILSVYYAVDNDVSDRLCKHSYIFAVNVWVVFVMGDWKTYAGVINK